MLTNAQRFQLADDIHAFILSYVAQHGRAPTHSQIAAGTGVSPYYVLRATARLQGQQRVHDASTRPVVQLE